MQVPNRIATLGELRAFPVGGETFLYWTWKVLFFCWFLRSSFPAKQSLSDIGLCMKVVSNTKITSEFHFLKSCWVSFLFPALPVSVFCAQTQASLEKKVLYPFKVVPGASSTTKIIKEKTQSNTQSRQEWMVQGQLTPICSRRVRLHIPGWNCHPQLHLHSPRSLPPPSSIPTRKARQKQFCGNVEFLLVNCPGWICKRTRSSCPNHFPRAWYYKNLISFLFCWRDRLKVYFTGTPFQVSLSPGLH